MLATYVSNLPLIHMCERVWGVQVADLSALSVRDRKVLEEASFL